MNKKNIVLIILAFIIYTTFFIFSAYMHLQYIIVQASDQYINSVNQSQIMKDKR